MINKIEQEPKENKSNKFKRKQKNDISFIDKIKSILKSNSKLGIAFNIILLVVIPCLILGTTVAKYMTEDEVDMEYAAKSFYFESDLLKEDISQAEYNYAQGIDSISFYLKNNADSLRISEVDIEYTVTLSKNGIVIDTKTGALAKDSESVNTIQFDNLSAGEYIVTAQANSIYSKTITGKFTLEGINENIEWDIEDSENSPIVKLTVISNSYEGLIKIAYPTGIQPDNADSKLETVTSTYVTSNFEKGSSYTYTFFKNDPTIVYTNENFSVTKLN